MTAGVSRSIPLLVGRDSPADKKAAHIMFTALLSDLTSPDTAQDLMTRFAWFCVAAAPADLFDVERFVARAVVYALFTAHDLVEQAAGVSPGHLGSDHMPAVGYTLIKLLAEDLLPPTFVVENDATGVTVCLRGSRAPLARFIT